MNEVIPSEYAKMVANLAKPGHQIIADLTPAMAHCWHMSSCIMGEAGELFDAIKKPAIYAKGSIDRANVIEEMGDLEFYMEGLRQALGITREETLTANTEKLLTGKHARYASGTYSNEAAQARADKVVPNGETTMPIHHVSIADPANMQTTVLPTGRPPATSGFAQTVPEKSAEGTSPMQQPGALSPEGADTPSPVPVADVQKDKFEQVDTSKLGTPVRQVTEKQMQECEAAHIRVDTARIAYDEACAALWKDPRNATLRRRQNQTFMELGQAQFELTQAFDAVPPRKE